MMAMAIAMETEMRMPMPMPMPVTELVVVVAAVIVSSRGREVVSPCTAQGCSRGPVFHHLLHTAADARTTTTPRNVSHHAA